MVDVPIDLAVTNPVLSIVATELSDDSHAEPEAAVAEPVNWEVYPIPADKLPDIVGKAFTVKVDAILQPLLFV